jgi:hypothetical protein
VYACVCGFCVYWEYHQGVGCTCGVLYVILLYVSCASIKGCLLCLFQRVCVLTFDVDAEPTEVSVGANVLAIGVR